MTFYLTIICTMSFVFNGTLTDTARIMATSKEAMPKVQVNSMFYRIQYGVNDVLLPISNCTLSQQQYASGDASDNDQSDQ